MILSVLDAPFSVSAGALLDATSAQPIKTREGFTVWGGRSNIIGHKAWDMPCPVGTPIYAPHSGTIVQAGSYGGCGITIGIARGNLRSDLCHLSQTKVFEGEHVTKGQLVGLSGNTGASDGPHLHWQMFRNGREISSKNALRAAQMQAAMFMTAGAAGIAAIVWWAVG